MFSPLLITLCLPVVWKSVGWKARKWGIRVCLHHMVAQCPDQKLHHCFPTLGRQTGTSLRAEEKNSIHETPSSCQRPSWERSFFPFLLQWVDFTSSEMCERWWTAAGEMRKTFIFFIFHSFLYQYMSENKLQRQRQILCTQGTSLHFLPLLFSSLDLSFHWLKIAHPAPPSIFPRAQNNHPEVLRPYKWLILTLHWERCTANYTEQSILNKYRLVQQIFSGFICLSPCCECVFTLRKCLRR